MQGIDDLWLFRSRLVPLEKAFGPQQGEPFGSFLLGGGLRGRHVVEQTPLGASPHVLSPQESGCGGQVVGGDAGDHPSGPPGRRKQRLAGRRLVAGEPGDRTPQHPVVGQCPGDFRFDGSQVLADDDGVAAMRFQCQYREHDIGVVVDVGTAIRALPGRIHHSRHKPAT